MEKEEKREISLKEILYWIVDNQEDTNSMDKINRTTFSFTSKYKNWKKEN